MVVGICDDDSSFRQFVKSTILGIVLVNESLEIMEYSSGEALLNSVVMKKVPDILFLDVEMSGKNGLETAEILRNQNEDMIIIFASNYREYILKSFYVKAFYFLVKPVSKEDLITEFQRAIKELQNDRFCYEFNYNGTVKRMLIHEIYYLSAYYRDIHVFTGNREYIFEGKLKEEEEKLTKYGFIRVHQGFLVNMRYIKDIGEKQIELVNGTKVDISVRKRSEVKRAYSKYLLERGM